MIWMARWRQFVDCSGRVFQWRRPAIQLTQLTGDSRYVVLTLDVVLECQYLRMARRQ